MRPLILAVVILSPLALAACGGSDKTVVVNPPPNASVVVPSDGRAKVCPAGTVC